MVYILADVVTRIKAAQALKLFSIKLRYSRMLLDILKIIHLEGIIRGYSLNCFRNLGEVEILLKYKAGLPVMKTISLVSTQSRRAYLTVGDLVRRRFNNNIQTISIISTTKGLRSSSNQIFFKNYLLSGEVLLKINI
jgi:small subunit ribosomal protein S8